MDHEQTGVYKVILHGRDINRAEHASQVITLLDDGTVTGDLTGTWSCQSDGVFRCQLDGTAYTGVMTTALDSKESAWVTCFTVLDQTGAALWGSHAAQEQ